MYNLDMNLVKVNGKTRGDLLTALSTLCEMDADFTGDNGIDYLWDGVDKNKYDSNMAYLLDKVKDKASDKEVIEEFIDRWIGEDAYYKAHSLNVIYDENEKAECIALAFVS